MFKKILNNIWNILESTFLFSIFPEFSYQRPSACAKSVRLRPVSVPLLRTMKSENCEFP